MNYKVLVIFAQRMKKMLHSGLFRNIASIGILQIANYIVPLLIVPFVTRALGKEVFGSVSYAQNIVAYLTLLVTYGYEYSATQDVALYRDDRDKLRTIFWTVIGSRLRLFALSLLLLVAASFFITRIQDSPLLYTAAALINLGVAIYPTWFFQGIEQMGKMAVAGFLIKAIGGVLIILLVTTPADGMLYLLLLSLAYVVVGIGTLIYVVKNFSVHKPTTTDKSLARSIKKRAFPIFLNAFFVSLYTMVGLTILGAYVDDSELGLYSGAYRIIMAIMTVSNTPINIGLFPVMSRRWHASLSEGWKFFGKALCIVGAGGVTISTITYFLAPLLVSILLGSEFTEAIILLRPMAVLPLLVMVSSLLTVQGLYGLRKQHLAPYLGFAVAFAGLTLNLLLIPTYGTEGAVWAWITSQVCEILIATTILIILRRRTHLQKIHTEP